jgi:hypothetical protein
MCQPRLKVPRQRPRRLHQLPVKLQKKEEQDDHDYK